MASNSIPGETNSNPVSRTQFLCKKASLGGLRTRHVLLVCMKDILTLLHVRCLRYGVMSCDIMTSWHDISCLQGTNINDLGGPEEISKMNLFFPGNPFRIKILSSAKPLKIYFFLGQASQNLFFLQMGLQIFFSSQRTASKIIFSWRVPLKIYFFLESASQNVFFLRESLSKFIFSWRVPLKINFFPESSSQNLFFPGEGPLKLFFSRFPPAPPPDH